MPQSSIRIEYDVRNRHILGPLFDRPGRFAHKTAVALLNSDASEFLYDRFEDNGLHYFFSVRPRSRSLQLANAQQCMEIAKKHEVEVLVYPELFACEEDQKSLVESFHSSPGSLRILAAGSSHSGSEAAHRSNRAMTSVVSTRSAHLRATFTHDKFEPFELHVNSETIIEAIATQRALRIHLGSDWAYAQVVCRDFLYDETRRAIEDLRVSIVTVPAYSEKADLFAVNVPSVSAGCHGAVTVANNPWFASPIHFSAIFGVRGIPRLISSLRVSDSKQLPAIAIFDADRIIADDIPPGSAPVLIPIR